MELETACYHSEETQHDSRQCSVLNSRLSKFELETTWDIKLVILVENFNTDSLSSITIKEEPLLAFSSDFGN